MRRLFLAMAAASALRLWGNGALAGPGAAETGMPCRCSNEIPARAAVVDSPMPPVSADFNLAGGVIWKKFRKMKDKYVLGNPAEGRAISIFKTCLKSRNAELAAEARAILDALADTRDVLGERLEEARAAGRPGVDEWIRLYLQSYPSRRPRFTARRPPKKEESVSKNGL